MNHVGVGQTAQYYWSTTISACPGADGNKEVPQSAKKVAADGAQVAAPLIVDSRLSSRDTQLNSSQPAELTAAVSDWQTPSVTADRCYTHKNEKGFHVSQTPNNDHCRKAQVSVCKSGDV